MPRSAIGRNEPVTRLVPRWRTPEVGAGKPRAGTTRKTAQKAPSRLARAFQQARASVGAAFERILVPIDFSPESTRALQFATALAVREGGRLILVHVVGPIYELRDYGYGPVSRRRTNEGLVRENKQRIRALGRRHLGKEVEWRPVVRSGTASQQILKAVDEFKASLIVMPTRGLSHAPPSEVGSTAERVVRHASCPVLVLPARRPARKA